MSKEMRIAENALEIMYELFEMVGIELPQICEIYEKNGIGFSDLKDDIISLAEKFERENTEVDWNEKNYEDEIKTFATEELFMLYGEKEVFYTETWDTYDIIAAADELDVCLSKDEIGEVIRRVKEVFDDKSNRNEIIVNIVEDIVKERRKQK